MAGTDKKGPTTRAIVLGVFLVLFGITLGVLTPLTLIGPLLGLIVAGFGIYIIWSSSTHGEPPGPVS